MQHLKDLIQRYLKGNASPEEVEALHEWYDSFDDSEVPLPVELGEDRRMLEQRLLNRLKPVMQPPKVKRIPFWRYAAAAALLALVAVAGKIGWQHRYPSPQKNIMADNTAATDKPPANKKAMLTLADGSTITLDDAANGALGKQGGANIIKKEKGQLAYQAADANGAVVYNTLTVPRGGQYQLVLPDGTNVWLNSATSLRYPTSFRGAERKVILQGQAYFEIAANATQPFKVQANEMEVVVLGTRFDMMAYADEPTINATLMDGKIKVQDKILRPGQQAVLALSGHQLTVRDADVNKIMAWKNGLFVFNNMDLPTILREIARWYDVEIVYQSAPGKELYGGGISRNLNLSAVLHVLEENGTNHFKTDGNKVVVLP
ncbi:FecR family protein [Chitinophaga ginsengisegetis]|uniref:FecR family protein n=1 Tax=Chitinophaga ginsengisegetis TaxID=393003 RepID=UPI000DB94D0D|nr:FecR family protein [Chitinophaga ginsengisegetis]MDR6567296.1 ferric-dicitrate binding protein FerR (iron transport regulator) [Chitinophaga ginsengisegetis]MDR6647027.1 ferric-dicitrate binding protein FerR (iron transport regulator) [Chitinophaga ginsengisegetis]MDR6653376.1 ferric-dicitrate binding protein FerR (iron transport regulator) [Chitinophaga ginsengisegetis]